MKAPWRIVILDPKNGGPYAFTFPTGKNYDYKPIAMTTGGAGGTVTFWTENFTGGVGGWSLVNVLGPEGSDPNFFQVTATCYYFEYL